MIYGRQAHTGTVENLVATRASNDYDAYRVGHEANYAAMHLTKMRSSEYSQPMQANARLIAAAPELLESLKEFVGLANFDADTVPKTTEEWDAMVAKAEAVIAKAEGE